MIYTSYFSKVKKIYGDNNNLEFVSIAGYKPNWFDNSLIVIHKYTKLSPKKQWWNIWHEKFKDCLNCLESINYYTNYYKKTVLDKLKPQDVYNDLMEISDRKNVVLLCYETPEKFCHRHLVSEWLNMNGIKTEEI